MDVNFIEQTPNKKPPEPSFRGFLLLLAATIAVLVAFGALLAANRIAGMGGIVTTLKGLLRSSDVVLLGERDDRITVLLLGIGGARHEGGYLTDTILLASVQPSRGKAALLSIPRDLAIPANGGEWRKINYLGAVAEQTNPGSGGDATRAALEGLLQIPIPYHVRIDFEGFVKAIDAVGGVTVTVENRFEDRRYPIPGNEYRYPVEERYEHIVFEKGTYTMDGQTALKYARSRRGGGIEGSDFSRVKRQQNVLVALKEKILSWQTLLRPGRIEQLRKSLAENVATNITLGEALRFFEIAKTIDQKTIRRVTLSDAPEGLLTARIVNGAYILEPRDGTFTGLRALAENIFSETRPEAPAPEKRTRIAILNGTTIAGLARTIGNLLATQDFMITHVGNAPIKPVAKTVIYDLTDGRDYLAHDRLRLLLDAVPPDTSAALTLPPFDAPPDFVIILGENTKLP